MADPPRHRGEGAGADPRSSRADGGNPGRPRPPHRPPADGRAVQGDRHPFAGVAGAGGVRMTFYRDAGPGDAAALDRIFDTSFCDTFAHLYRPEDLETFLSSFGIADWERQLANPAFAFRIAECDEGPVGYAKLGPMKLPIEHEPNALLLDELYVLKEHHGTGTARELMGWAVEEARRRGAGELF